MKKPADYHLKNPKDKTPLPVNRVAKALTDLVKESGHKREDLDPEISSHQPLIAAYEALDATNVPLVTPKDKTAGLANFVRMIIDELENENFKEAHYLAIDLWNDIGTTYVIK